MSTRNTFTVDGNATFTPAGNKVRIKGLGTWGSGTLQVAEDVDGGPTYENLPGMSWTADFMTTIDVVPGRLHRLNLSGSTTPNLVVAVDDLKTDTKEFI